MTVKTELELGDVQTITPNDSADTDALFKRIWRLNPDARIEQTALGEIIIMPPAGGESGNQSGEAYAQLHNWARQDGTGITFDSSTTFRLPNGAKRSPDASWVRSERIRALSKRAPRISAIRARFHHRNKIAQRSLETAARKVLGVYGERHFGSMVD